jgi:hypothetical protein
MGAVLWCFIPLGLAIVYGLPSLVAFARWRDDAPSIFVVNLLLGWTILGWIVALAWAVDDRHS